MACTSGLASWSRLLARPVSRALRPLALHSRLTPGAARQLAAEAPAQRQHWRTAAAAVDAEQQVAASQQQQQGGAAAPLRDVVEVLRSRGLLQDVTSLELGSASNHEQLLAYCGFDPTAESLHLGNLLGIIVLAWFQRCGHVPVALLGGATGRVGDPSGKSAERPVLSEEVIERNVAGIERTLRTLLRPPPGSGLAEPLVLNNLDWYGPMGLLTFLREIGKYARVGTMLAKESVRKRMESESGISYTEFTYQLLQGYDFVHMRRQFGVRVQVGGSDQWGNILAGTDLMRRMMGGPEEAEEAAGSTNGSISSSGGSISISAVAAADDSAGAPPSSSSSEGFVSEQCFGLTFPLLLKADGSKFGKSESGALWLNADMLSPYQFYQNLFKTTDEDVVKFLRMLTFLSLEEVAAIAASMQSPGYVANTAQRRLAEEVTRFVHGEEGLAQAIKTTEALAPGAATKLDADSLEDIAGDAPSASLPREQLVGALLADVMVAVGMQPSKGAVRRMIKGGGVRVNNEKVDDELAVLAEEDLIDGRLLLIATGKKNKMLVRVAA
ncbi:tyrosyl-tRNA synthetase [Micractinium conductrix]|uniref:Tyrosine--tRNA ligase n=1 Tax=Micractinium conductrix TaxID=554055 RepID=A0A2P6V8S3_9CHLO|nr:tyrosyl-tRNA synthetase [Micractinium conductrix]|eukprot:PSC70485.1 tyrosyl-tRNA synthetase [Micractinium conductrix]